MNRLFQGAATVDSILRGDLIERAAEAGLRSLFVGFETLTPGNLRRSNKRQNLGRDYSAVTARLHSLGIMINGSFVFGMDDDDEDVFRRTVDWAIEHGITTATFHIQTPYPGTRLLRAHGRARAASSTRNWDLYDTRHVVFRPARLTPEALKNGYDWAYREFYRWSSIARRVVHARHPQAPGEALRLCRGLEEVRVAVESRSIRARQLRVMTPVLEGGALEGVWNGRRRPFQFCNGCVAFQHTTRSGRLRQPVSPADFLSKNRDLGTRTVTARMCYCMTNIRLYR